MIHALGSFIDQPVSLSSKGNLFWLSPGGITISGAGGFQNVQHLQLSTATGLRIGTGIFDAYGTTADQAALLQGEPLRGRAGLVSDPATLSAMALERNGDLTLSGGLLTVEESLLLDAQGGNVLLQAAQVLLPGGQVEVAGREVSLQNSQVDVGSPEAVGGGVRVEGETISLTASRIDASGRSGGGEVGSPRWRPSPCRTPNCWPGAKGVVIPFCRPALCPTGRSCLPGRHDRVARAARSTCRTARWMGAAPMAWVVRC